jgi:hypothetical protein
VQIVNSLPWEKLEVTRQMLDTTARLHKQLVEWGPQRPLVEGDFPTLQPRVDELLTGKLCGIALGIALVFKRLVHWLEKFEQRRACASACWLISLRSSATCLAAWIFARSLELRCQTTTRREERLLS